MHSFSFFIVFGALTAYALPQSLNGTDGFVDSSYSDADLAALDSIIGALNSNAVTTGMSTDAATRTAFGYVAVGSGTVTFSDIAVRATSSAIPDLNLEITQYINPITTSPPRREIKRDLFKHGQVPIDICPVPKTITVIEWVDCVATPISCDVCPVLDPTSAEPDCTTTTPDCTTDPPPPCSTSTPTCTSATKSCPTCPGGVEYIILAESDPNNYKTK
jgi:hypothetical protein